MPVIIGTPEDRGQESVLAVLRGDGKALPLSTALALVTGFDMPVGEREMVLGSLLHELPDPAARSAVARALGRLDNDESAEQVHKAIEQEEEGRVIADLALALGFIGARSDIELLESVANRVRDAFALERIRFAAGLIAHRLGEDLDGVPIPPVDDRQPTPDGDVHAIRAFQIGPEDRAWAIEGVHREPVGIEARDEHIYGMDCGPRKYFVVLNPPVVGDVPALAQRKALLGVVESIHEVADRASPAQLVLTAPREDGRIDVLVCRTTGEPLHRGTAEVVEGRLDARLWSLDRIGVPAIELLAQVGADELRLEGVSGSTFRKGKPTPLVANR